MKPIPLLLFFLLLLFTFEVSAALQLTNNNTQNNKHITNLANLPYPFINEQTAQQIPILFVTPSTLKTTELIPTFLTARIMGGFSTWHKVNLVVKNTNSLQTTDLANNNLIFAATFQQLRQFKQIIPYIPLKIATNNSFLTTNKQKVPSDCGVIILLPSPWNAAHAVLLLTGENAAAVSNAILALGQNQTRQLMHGNLVLIQPINSTNNNNNSHKKRIVINLQQIGYLDTPVNKTGNSHVLYNLYLPNDQTPKRLDIYIDMSHSSLLSADHSTVTFFINDFAIQTIGLFPANSNHYQWHLTVPSYQLYPGLNTIDFSFHINLANKSVRNSSSVWASIHNNTVFDAKFSDIVPTVTLNKFPLPFDNDTVLILPDSLIPFENSTLINLCAYLGKKTGLTNSSISIISAANVQNSDLVNHNIILFGDLDGNSKFASTMSKMPVFFHNNSLIFSKNIIRFVSSKNKPLGLLQIISSPWNNKFQTLIIGGSNPDQIDLVTHLLINPKPHALNVTAAVFDANGRTIATNFSQLTHDPNMALSLQATSRSTKILFSISGLLLLCIILIKIIHWKKARSLYRFRPGSGEYFNNET